MLARVVTVSVAVAIEHRDENVPLPPPLLRRPPRGEEDRGAGEAKEHMKHYKGHVKVWAFTSVAADYDGRGAAPMDPVEVSWYP